MHVLVSELPIADHECSSQMKFCSQNCRTVSVSSVRLLSWRLNPIHYLFSNLLHGAGWKSCWLVICVNIALYCWCVCTHVYLHSRSQRAMATDLIFCVRRPTTHQGQARLRSIRNKKCSLNFSPKHFFHIFSFKFYKIILQKFRMLCKLFFNFI